MVGYYLVGLWDGALPYFLTIAASSFIYVAWRTCSAAAKRLSAAQTLAQIAWLAGIIAVTVIGALAHHGR